MKRFYLTFFFFGSFAILSFGQQAWRGIGIRQGDPSTRKNFLRDLRPTQWESLRFRGKYYVLLHLDLLPGEEEKKTLASLGIRLYEWLPGNVFMAEIGDSSALSSLEEHHVVGAYAISPASKLLGDLRSGVATLGPHDLIAVGYAGSLDAAQASAELHRTGAEVVFTKVQPPRTLFIRAGFAALRRIADLPFITYLSQQHLEDIALNYNNRATHGLDALSAAAGRNLQGTQVTLGMGDDGDPSTHIDFAGRLNQRNPAAPSAHSTHSTGTAAGGGILNPKYHGMAPQASIVSQYFSDILVNAPTYITDYNMVLTNNSYYSGNAGCSGEGVYDDLASYTDMQLDQNPHLLHVFAAGNDGALTCSPYPADFATIKSGFQCAKDALTVGGIDNTTYGIKPGSSRGPVQDGRIKPEIMAGGQNIYSTFPYNTYGYLSGTSMSAPTVTGTLALLYQRYRQLHGGADPTAALIKALACNSADDLGNPGPDYTFGFGMLNARTSVESLEKGQYFTGSMSNGGTTNFTISGVPAGLYQIKVMLYWPDVAAAAYASSALVNDLDLTVTAPDASMHLPMILNPSPANVNNNAVEGVDTTNNIEQVVINNPPAGNFTVSVKGTRVPSGPQSFAIAYQVIAPSVTVEYPFGGETWVPGESEYIRWSTYGGGLNSFTIEYSADSGNSWTVLSSNVAAGARLFPWVVPPTATSKALVQVICNGTGLSGMSHYPFTVLGQPTLVADSACPGYTQLVWNSIPSANLYQIMLLRGDSMQVVASTTDTSFLFAGLNRDSSYWFSVRALDSGAPGRRALAVNVTPNNGSCSLPAFQNDFSIDSLISPRTGRQYTSSVLGNNVSLQVEVKNLGSTASSGPLSLSYQVNGGSTVTESYGSVVPGQSTLDYTFVTPYDFSAAGSYRIRAWVSYPGDSLPANDTVTQTISQLRNDTIPLSPSFTEGFETAAASSYGSPTLGFVGLDRCDFFADGQNGRARTFVNSGFARTGDRCATLDQVTNTGFATADSLIMTFNLSNQSPGTQLWLNYYYKNQGIDFSLPGNRVWIRGSDQATWIFVDSLTHQDSSIGVYQAGKSIDITGTLASAIPAQTATSSFQVKFGEQGYTSTNSVIPDGDLDNGYSFDDITITKSSMDVAALSLVAPITAGICNLSNAESVSLQVKSYSRDTLTNIPVSYSLNGTIVTESIPVLNPGQILTYTFTQKANLSAYQSYNLGLWVAYPGDTYHLNDSLLNIVFQTTPVISSYPYLEGFESSPGFWYTQGVNDSWQWGTPVKQVINKAANGTKCWVTSLTGNYNNNELSYLISPCFDLSSLAHPMLSFSHIFQTEDDCDCDYHWVEYSTDGINWTKLGSVDSGTNWYDNSSRDAWQLSYTKWHVSSYAVPVNTPRVQFRIVMSSDPATNYEGVGIDDVHLFDQAPIYNGANISSGLLQGVSGTNWIDFTENGQVIASLNPNGQDLGNTSVRMFINHGPVRNSNNQYYLDRNLVIQPTNPAVQPVSVRFYFLDSEAVKLIQATGCSNCTTITDAYESGITQYSKAPAEEDSTLNDNLSGAYRFIPPRQSVTIIPNENGYYAEFSVTGFSEFWINGGGPNQNQALPLVLQNFTATRVNATGVLQWTLSPGTLVDSFVVEKCMDDVNFLPIGELAADTGSMTASTYSFTDNNLAKGITYYRLRLIDSGGAYQYSATRRINYTDNDLGIIIYPNPVSTGTLTVSASVNCNRLLLYDASGRLVRDLSVLGMVNTLYTGDLAKGVYLIRIQTDAGSEVHKIVVE